jgi:hypothetical protein
VFRSIRKSLFVLSPLLLAAGAVLFAQEPDDARARVQATLQKMSAIMAAARAHLAERYDLSDRPAAGVTMSRSKPVQEGVRVKLPSGATWQSLAAMSPEA